MCTVLECYQKWNYFLKIIIWDVDKDLTRLFIHIFFGYNMIIRSFRLDDLDEVLCIEYDNFNDPYPSGVLVHFHETGVGFLVAEIANRVVGFIIFWIVDNKGHIIMIAVNNNYKNMGIGSLLLNKVKQILFSNNIITLTLEVRKSNLAARKFYLKNGFYEVVEKEHYYSDGEDGIIMQFDKKDDE